MKKKKKNHDPGTRRSRVYAPDPNRILLYSYDKKMYFHLRSVQ